MSDPKATKQESTGFTIHSACSDFKIFNDHIDGTWIPDLIPSGISLVPMVPKCECGTSITLGKDDHPMHHSSWCPIKMNENGKR